jgi:hypothetical protein
MRQDITEMDEIKLIIKKTAYGITVYDEDVKNRIELFPNTQEGYDRFMEYVGKYMSQRVSGGELK